MTLQPTKLQTFIWAASQHEEFCYCLIYLPLSFGLRRRFANYATIWAIETHWRKPRIYIPWKVENAHRKAIGLITEDEDDIPF